MQATFIPYSNHQQELFLLDLNSLIPKNHLVRLIDTIVHQSKTSDILKEFKGGGRSDYHPRIKILFYEYFRDTFPFGKIAKATKENINFIWLSRSLYDFYY